MQTFGIRLTLFISVAVSATAQPPFTAAQMNAGRSAYQDNCASCHLPDLAGRNEAPQLSGGNFMLAWGGRSASALATYMQETMPPGNPGSLGKQTYLDIAAFVLEANGAKAGPQPLTASSTEPIKNAANGQMPTALHELLSVPTSDQAGLSQQVGPKGYTVRGEVKN